MGGLHPPRKREAFASLANYATQAPTTTEVTETLQPHGSSKTTPIELEEEQKDEIVRIAASYPESFCRSVIWFSISEHFHMRQALLSPFKCASNIEVRRLEGLPPELFQEVFLRLDVRSLLTFRQTSLRCRQIVDSLKQYRAMVNYGFSLSCALFRLQLASDISLIELYDVLCTKSCTLCGAFGGFVFLLSWKRCCFECLRVAPEAVVVSFRTIRTTFHMTNIERSQLRLFKTLPGTYSLQSRVQKTPITVASLDQANSIRGFPPRKRMRPLLVRTEQNGKLTFMASCALPYYEPFTGKVDHGVVCVGCVRDLDLETDDPRRRSEWIDERDKIYARDGFLEHFKSCEHAQRQWGLSILGKEQPVESTGASLEGDCFLKGEE